MWSKRSLIMKNIKSFLLLHLGLLIFSLGSLASKYCSFEPFLSFRYLFFLSLQLMTLFIYALIWQKVLKDVPLTLAYANKGITIIWGMLIGYLFFKEKITSMNLIGAFIIIAGIVILSTGEKDG